jgi:uncharacterized protein
MTLIRNITRGTTVASKARIAGSFIARSRGLMFSDPMAQGEGLVIAPCNSIHMFFMRFPLDILFLDAENRVVFMYEGIKPWRVGRIVRGAKSAIELPERTIAASSTKVGDIISVG